MTRLLLLFGLVSLFAMGFTQYSGENKKKMKVPKGFVYVPSGQVKEGDKTVSVQGFFMLSTEVSNLDYREFLYHLEAAGRKEDLAKAQVHAEGWVKNYHYGEEMAVNYYLHPAYENYPVVNITREAAQLYCQWLQKQLQLQNPDFKVKVRLPHESEWVLAARSGHDDYPYSNGQYLRNKNGDFLYNFKYVGEENLHRDAQSGKMEVIKPASKLAGNEIYATYPTVPGNEYKANDYGLYNMCGNVAEMIAEDGRTKGGSFNCTGYDIRIDAPDVYAGVQEASPYIGFRVVMSAVGE